MPSATAQRKRAEPRLFHRLADPAFLTQAWRQVLAHYPSGQTPAALQEFDRRRAARLDSLASQLRSQTFLPQPASLIHIPKPSHPGEQRPIALLQPEDRIVLTALNLPLTPILDRTFLPGSFAYRPNRGAGAAIETVHQAIQDGCRHVATGDVDEFFASIDRALLLKTFRRRIWETPILNLMETYLHIGVTQNLQWSDTGFGIAQGSALSPLLSNLYLVDFDRYLESTSLRWVRYADNILLLGPAAEPVQTAWRNAAAFLETNCRLRLNPASCVVTTADAGFEFLGFCFRGLARSMSPAKLDQKRTELTTVLRQNTADLKRLVADLSETMLGWRHYYGSVQGTRPQLESLERHLEDLLVPWLQSFRSRSHASAGHSAPELKAILLELELPALTDQRKKLKWIELLLSRSRPAPAVTAAVSPLTAKAIHQRKQQLAERRQFLEEIVITKPGTYLGRTGERVLIRRDGKREAEVPFSLVRNITFLTTAISLSGEFMVETAARGIPILIAGVDGRPAVRIGAPDLPSHELSVAQSTLANSPAALDLARIIVAGKIRNQVNLLQYFLKYPERRTAPGADFLATTTQSIAAMQQGAQEVSARQFSADHELERNRLFAAEGQAAQSYWSAVRALLWWKPGFDKRVHRGAPDLVNSLLNYGYGILYSRLWVVLVKAGLNVNIGFLHKPQPGKAGLLFDFIEEFPCRCRRPRRLLSAESGCGIESGRTRQP